MENVFIKLSETNSRLDKEKILYDFLKEHGNELRFWLDRALNPFVTYGIKKVPHTTKEIPYADPVGFDTLLERLESRELTGNDALTEIDLYVNCPQWENFYRRILTKDLRCGVTVKTVNKVLKQLEMEPIPVFECQLAVDTKGGEMGLTGEKQIESKLDGVRCLAFIRPNRDVKLYSRNGKEFHNFDHIVEELKEIELADNMPIVIDGEIMSKSFQDLMCQVQRKYDASAEDAVLNAFDILPEVDFLAGSYSVPQHIRTGLIQSLCDTYEFKSIVALSAEYVNLDTTEGRTRLDEINKKALDGGYEGIMLKDPDASYKCKRNKAWLKMKPYIEETLTIVAIEEGKGKYEGTTGALVCEGAVDGKTINVNVGSGLTDEMRDDLWFIKQKAIGELVEIRADAISRNKNGTYSMRFPRFKCFRSDAFGNKL